MTKFLSNADAFPCVYKSDSQIAICMEYCEGGSLDAIYRRIKERQGRTGEKVLGKIAEAVSSVLSSLQDMADVTRTMLRRYSVV